MATAATMSGPMFDALPDEEGRRWELLDGDLIDVSSATPLHQLMVFMVQTALQRHLPPGGLQLADVEFAMSEDVRIRPDVCVLLPNNAAMLDFERIPIPGFPDLAVEVISPTERAVDSHRKVLAYLRHGVAKFGRSSPKRGRCRSTGRAEVFH